MNLGVKYGLPARGAFLPAGIPQTQTMLKETIDE
jgi:hypothetical protein